MQVMSLYEVAIWFIIIFLADICAVEWELHRRRVEIDAYKTTVDVLEKLYKDRLKRRQKAQAKQIKTILEDVKTEEKE